MKLCFIIASRYSKNHISYLPRTILTIQTYYPEATILLVNNNSDSVEIYEKIPSNPTLFYMLNTSAQKYELGAYNFATDFIKQKGFVFDYYICLQDTMVFIHPLNFETFETKACSIGHIRPERMGHYKEYSDHFLRALGFQVESYLGCWCCSWICTHESLLQIYEWTHTLPIVSRDDSMLAERFMGGILQVLNKNRAQSIEGFEDELNYDCHFSEADFENVSKQCKVFLKCSQGKGWTSS